MVTTPYDRLLAFLAESNKIEGIFHVRPAEIATAETFLRLQEVTIPDVSNYVRVTANAELRDKPGFDIRIGLHYPPPGGPDVVLVFQRLLDWVNSRQIEPFDAHREYERLHPYTDGNGRSGRLLWLWQMQREGRSTSLDFLHRWYYDSLSHGDNDNIPEIRKAA